MIFNSIDFYIFFIITLMLYYFVKDKYRYIILLLASYYFYGYANVKHLLILVGVTFISYIAGILVDRVDSIKKQKGIIAISTFIIVFMLLYFKYINFIFECINSFLSSGISIENLVVPLGISFFTLQAISYPIDVYRGDVVIEKNILKYSLFVSFFPQILSGPIGKAKEMLPQINEIHNYNGKEVFDGVMIMIYGLFKKVVVADLMAIGVNNVYGNLYDFKGIPLLIVLFAYSFQIYFDFSSYSNIAYGCGKVFGYKLNKNFNFPYMGDSIKNFWSRWHISLSTWFRDYLYFPLGGNRKGKYRCYFNILVVFLVSGLWHGAAWTYIVWGGLHAIYQIMEREFNLRFKIYELNVLKTFILVTFAWIFFRASSCGDVIYIISNVFKISLSDLGGQILSIGWDKYDLIILTISVVLILIFEFFEYKRGNVYKKVLNLSSYMKIFICFVLIFSAIIFGCYGPGFDNSQFIYLGY